MRLAAGTRILNMQGGAEYYRICAPRLRLSRMISPTSESLCGLCTFILPHWCQLSKGSRVSECLLLVLVYAVCVRMIVHDCASCESVPCPLADAQRTTTRILTP